MGRVDYGVVDQHYYVNFTDLFYNHDLYDSYARPADDPFGYYDVFVGEYAANSNIVRSSSEGVFNGTTTFSGGDVSNWRNALSEAAMMTGFERNGDIVKLAAYAPMFANLNGARQWWVDMMYYTNTDLVLSPSYYVQQLFMQNSGDYKVASELTYASGSPLTVTFTGSGSAKRTVNQLYYVTSADEETGATGGMKLSMFDVSDPADVQEKDTFVMENVYSGDVLYDYRAALVDPERNLIGFSAYDGARERYYVFSYDRESGFTCRMEARVSGAGYSAARGLYIGDVLYVVKGNIIEMYRMEDYKKTGDLIL